MRQLLAVILLASSTAHQVNERAGADFVQRSLDKTIIVDDQGQVQTIPGRDGTRVIYTEDEDDDPDTD